MLVRIKTLREATGVSQRALAESIGVSQQSVNKYENHNIEPDIETLIRIADYFHVSIDYLVGHNESISQDYTSVGITEDEHLHLQRYRLLTQVQKQSINAVICNYLHLSRR